MDIFKTKWDTKSLRKINQCRLYLKVNLLSEIVNMEGDTILEECYEVIKKRQSTSNNHAE